MACLVQDYTYELKLRLTSTKVPSKDELDRFCQLTLEAIQLRDKHICLFGSQARTETGLDSNQQSDPLSLCPLAMFYELWVGASSQWNVTIVSCGLPVERWLGSHDLCI